VSAKFVNSPQSALTVPEGDHFFAEQMQANRLSVGLFQFLTQQGW
jgi:hypothetical protein